MNKNRSNENPDRLYEPVLKRERVFDGIYLRLDRMSVRLPDGT
jgi:hypothetical protein